VKLKAQWLPDLSAEDYYADRVLDVPTLNYSTAALMVNRSSRHAWHSHPRLGGKPSPAGDGAMSGIILHNLILEGGRDVVTLDYDDFRSKAAKEERDELLALRKIPVLKSKLEPYAEAALNFSRNALEFGINLVSVGRREATIHWQERSRHGLVDCRARLDAVVEAIVYDIKTTSGSAHPDACARRIYERGYHIQASAYRRAVERVEPDLVGRVKFVFLFFETEPPYSVVPLTPSGALRELGDRDWERAVEKWAECRKNDRWPGYVSGIEQVDPLPWALSRDLDQEAA